MLREMNSIPEFQLTETQYALLRQRMRSLYEHIRHHPALHQRYLWVGKGRPDIDPDIGTSLQPVRQTGESREVKLALKRKLRRAPSQEICKTDRQWGKQINNT
ncbi:hypothetical protein AVEN_50019-1 [Araneus ventricosus]|uniref:Uncharacterized protein n=1 Tax=Araneus ventricosus TaxID=182803 RepID=A0A4Y2D2G1_ARAVE|nr:hypothetical protein AVEN_50019-1 [Araneus ventricosus]